MPLSVCSTPFMAIISTGNRLRIAAHSRGQVANSVAMSHGKSFHPRGQIVTDLGTN